MGGRNVHPGDENRLGNSAICKSTVVGGARTRSALLLASALGCTLSIFVTATPAAALPTAGNECGPVTVNGAAGSVTCNATSGTGNTYPNGITYTATQPVDLTVVLQGGTTGAVNVIASGTGVTVNGYADHAATVTTYAGAKVTGAADGIDVHAYGTGLASINNAATVTAVDRGLWAHNQTGDASVVNTGAITIGTGAANYAIGIVAGNANGTATVTNSGAITVNTGATYAYGVATAANGAQTINNNAGGAISVTGAGFTVGLQTYATGGTTTTTINNADAITATSTGAGGSAFGIQSNGEQTAVVDLTGTGSVTANGYNATGVQVSAYSDVTVTGATGATIAANTSGGHGAGVFVSSQTGTATIKVDGVSTTGAATDGVYVRADHGATVEVGHIANGKTYGVVTTGDGSTGVQASSNDGQLSVTNHGLIQTAGADAAGVNAFSRNGAVTVTNDAGAVIHTTGQGSSYSYAGASGVYAGSRYGSVTVTNNGSIVTEGDKAQGVEAYSYSGALSVTNHGSIRTSGANSRGVSAYSYNGQVTITNDADAVIHTTGNGSTGIYAGSPYASSTVTNAGSIVTEGDSAHGVFVSTGNTGGSPFPPPFLGERPAGAQASYSSTGTTAAIANTGTITTSGANSVGAYASSRDGLATITSNSVTTSGNSSAGLMAKGKYAASVTTGAVTTHGDNSAAVVATSLGIGIGPDGPVPGYSNVHVTGALVTTGANSNGVNASSYVGTVTVDGSGAITTSGANSTAISALGKYATTVNVTGAVSATGAGSVGVEARSNGYGGTTVTVGKVTADSLGVIAHSQYGGTTVTINGAVSSLHDQGVEAVAYYGATNVTVSHGGSVAGATGGIWVLGYNGSTVTNHGVISATSGFAVDVASPYGVASVVNAADGQMTGAVHIDGAYGSTFTNAGSWTVTGDSSFGAPVGPLARPAGVSAGSIGPSGVIDNTGTVHVSPTSGSTVTVTGLVTFNNAGTVDMRDGHAGQTFNLGGATFAATTGQSQLAVDVDSAPGAAKADKLVTGAVTGKTTVLVQDVTTGGGGGFNVAGATVVQAATGTAADAFVLGTTRNGFVNYTLTFDPTSTTWNLHSLPSHAVFETLKLPQLSQAFAERSDDVWFQRMQEVRDASAARKDGFEFWGQVYGGGQDVGGARTFSLGGGSFSEDLSTRSTWGGVQFGVDHVSPWRSGRLLWGFTAGYLEQWSVFSHAGSSATFAGGQLVEAGRAKDSIDVKGANLGGYVGYTQGGWFLNGLAKVDFGGVDANLNSVQLKASTNATIWGVNGEFGYRFGGAGLFVEPVVKLEGGDTNVDKLAGGNAVTSYPDNTNLLATVGARVGGQASAGGVSVSPWAGAYVADELLGENRAGFSLGGTTLDLRDQPVRTFARFDVGATVKGAFGVEGFAKAGADTGSGVSGWTANLGVRWRW